MKNINGDIVFSIQLFNVKVVFSLEHEKMGIGYNKLNKHQDYEVFSDNSTLFIKITKHLECEEKHHLKIKVLQPNGAITEWITNFQPKGSIMFIYLIVKQVLAIY